MDREREWDRLRKVKSKEKESDDFNHTINDQDRQIVTYTPKFGSCQIMSNSSISNQDYRHHHRKKSRVKRFTSFDSFQF